MMGNLVVVGVVFLILKKWCFVVCRRCIVIYCLNLVKLNLKMYFGDIFFYYFKYYNC